MSYLPETETGFLVIFSRYHYIAFRLLESSSEAVEPVREIDCTGNFYFLLSTSQELIIKRLIYCGC